MNFAMTDEQREWKQRCRAFARDVIRPVAPIHDAEESIPWEVMREAHKQGLAGLGMIERTGADPEGQLGPIHAEELHWGCAGIALAVSGSGLAAAGLAASGSSEQIARWVPECLGVGDEVKIGAYAGTEPSAGSDVKSLRTTARRDGEQWVLNGTKAFITNGGIADVNVVVATVDPELGHRGQASFVIPKGTPGLQMGKKESKLGIRASQTAELVLEDCRIPLDHLLGGIEKLEKKLARARAGESSGRASNALATFELTRPIVGAAAIGIAQAAYEWTLEYLLGEQVGSDPIADWLDESSTSGRPLHQQQRVQQVLADVATEIDASRLLVQRASWMGRSGIPMVGGQGSMSKLKAGDVAMWATTALLDLVGPAAAGSPLEKWFRDAKIYQLFEGTAQVQRLVISRMQIGEYRERMQEAQQVMAAAEAEASGDAREPALAPS